MTSSTLPSGDSAIGRSVERFRRETVGTNSPVEVMSVVSTTLLEIVPADVWCAVLLDPATLLDTGGVHEHGFPAELMPRLFEIEHADQIGVDNLRQLVRQREPVSVLSCSTRGDMERSEYFQDILRPAGMGDEMRVLLREGSRTWGLLCWCRESSWSFSDADVAAATALGGPDRRTPARTAGIGAGRRRTT